MTLDDKANTTAPAQGSGDVDAACPGCAKPLPANASRCAHCGLAFGEHQRCARCHAIADVAPDPEVKFVCTVCGAVRIPIDDPAIVRSDEQIELVKKTTLARSARAVWRVVATVAAGFGVFSVLVLWLVISVAHPAPIGQTVATLAALVPFAFAILAARKARTWQGAIQPTLEKAWQAAAADIGRASSGELSAKKLAELTRTSEATADQLLGRMSAQSLLVSSVTPEGSLKYSLLDGAKADSTAALPGGHRSG